MNHLLHCAALIAAAATCGAAMAQSINDAPLTEKWAPSEWGQDDRVGAPNRTTPRLVLEAVKLVKQGKVATLGKVYATDAPAFGTRSWRLLIPGLPTGGPFGGQQLVYNDEYVATELGHTGSGRGPDRTTARFARCGRLRGRRTDRCTTRAQDRVDGGQPGAAAVAAPGRRQDHQERAQAFAWGQQAVAHRLQQSSRTT